MKVVPQWVQSNYVFVRSNTEETHHKRDTHKAQRERERERSGIKFWYVCGGNRVCLSVCGICLKSKKQKKTQCVKNEILTLPPQQF